MRRLALHPSVSLAVLASNRGEAAHHEDFGCSIQGPVARPVRRAMQPLEKRLARLPREEALKHAAELVRWLEATPRYDALCDGKRRVGGRRRLREEILFPDPALHRPRFLHVRRGALGLDVPVRASEWPLLADALSALGLGATEEALRDLAERSELVGGLLADLADAGWIEPVKASKAAALSKNGVLFVGHNTVLFAPGRTRLLIDPYFRPMGELDAPDYRPLQPRDLGPVDAIALTHSHGDHLHLGSLLQFPRATPILVPVVERESLFTSDFARRLGEVGFTNVVPMKWGEERRIGDLTVRALSFYGEQPTDGEGLYEGLWNVGNTWLARHEKLSAVFLADAGRDARGDIRDVCRKVGREAPVDVLFTGIRGFRLRPLFYGATTLQSFLVDVPLDRLTAPQQLMADPEQALDYGELLGARYVVPCADGGAPWYWREGMGPAYPGYPGEPGVKEAPHEATENPDADPFPERLVQVRARRKRGPQALVLRPGEALRFRGKSVRIESSPITRWPFGNFEG